MTSPQNQRTSVFEPWDINAPPTAAPASAFQRPASPAPSSTPPPAWSRSSPMVLDARPMLLRRDDSIWARAERARDELYDAIMRTCDQESIDALVVKSGPFAVPAAVSFECWLPVANPLLTERARATISVTAREYHRFDLEYSVEIEDRGAVKRHDRLWRFDAGMAATLVKYLLRRGEKPSYAGAKLRQVSWQVWRKRNKVVALGRDWAVTGNTVAVVMGLMLMMSGRVDLMAVGASLTGVAVGVGIYLKRRPLSVQSSGKPDAEPRTLTQVDSWQTAVPSLGADAMLLRDRVVSQLRTNRAPNFRSRLEHIWHWGLDGKEEREQIVLGLGRAICFCHVYRYGNDLYVGWDGHVNYGQWVEARIATGWSKTSQRLTTITTALHGFQPISEYDLTDLNCLMEWTHSKLTEQVKHLLEERQIDAEIDFRINRGERQGLTGRREPNGVGAAAASLAKRFQRKLVRTD